MKVVIAGSRGIKDPDQKVDAAVRWVNWCISLVISGTCEGVDKAGERWAENFSVPVQRYPAYWKTHGKSAGPIRNKIMAKKADAVIAIWDGKSRGTKNMIDEALKLNKPVFIWPSNLIRQDSDEMWGNEVKSS